MSHHERHIRLPAPWARRSVAAGALMSLACLPLGGCIIVKGGGHKHESRDTLTLSEATAQRLVIRNHVGDVHLIADPSATEITATAVLIGKGKTPDAAEEALAEIAVTLDPSPRDRNVVEALADHPSGNSRKNYAVEWRITAPASVQVDVHNEVGDIEISGVSGPVFVRSDVGDVSATEIAGGLTVNGGVGDVNASASGPVDVKTDVGGARVKVLGATPHPINITTDVGEIVLLLPEHWAGTLNAETDTGDVHVALPGMPVTRASGRQDRFRGQVGSGGVAATLEADVGNIAIKSH